MDTTVNPKDSIKSTWRYGNRDEWTIYHRLIDYLNIYPVDTDREVPVHSKDEKIPYMPQWSVHRWILFYSAIPLLIHQVYSSYTGRALGPIAAFNYYFFWFNIIVIHEACLMRGLGHKYGFLDGDKHERDGIPDVGVSRVVQSLYKTTGSRLAMSIYFTYNANQLPAAMNWAWLPLQIGLYGIVLDFWFYWYHRAMHDVSFLWKFHRTHHLTKHPNSLLSAYADHEQEFFDMVGVPFFTYMTLRVLGLPLGFYEWWICHAYIAFTEVLGHSGLRVHGKAASTLSWLLELLDADIVIEDHDLHHRKGYRKSHNYGKQTRLWDRIFGTCHERIESARDQIDYVNTAPMPLY
ncbi:hypothetical protein BJX61DRAFT_55746 [Aspergillus egyptiacus]|nr:hypothetical protein BJX61DRAFT_55746 [Aspergillus egyptiacus]